MEGIVLQEIPDVILLDDGSQSPQLISDGSESPQSIPDVQALPVLPVFPGALPVLPAFPGVLPVLPAFPGILPVFPALPQLIPDVQHSVDIDVGHAEQVPVAASSHASDGASDGHQSTQPPSLDVSAVQFQSPKKYKVPSPHKQSAAADESDGDDAENCPICFEAWTNSGKHRLSSLKCGHLFGQSCIEKWLKGQGGKCPQCNTKAHRKDIRVLYAKTLKIVDTSERDEAVAALQREQDARRRAEMDAAEARLRQQMALDECKRLQQQIERQRSQMDVLRTLPGGAEASSSEHVSSSNSNIALTYTVDRTIKISEVGQCRVMAFCPHLATLCVSQPSASTLFPGFGIKKVNCLDLRTSQYVALHSKMVRDISFNTGSQDGLLLSCAVDKTLKITSMISNAVVQTYTAPAPVWSCAWNVDDANYFYSGLQNGNVMMYDVRNTATHCHQLNTQGSCAPVVSLHYLRHNPAAMLSAGGLVVGQLDKAYFFERLPGSEEHRPHALPVEGSMTCLSVEDSSNHLLASFRPTARHPSVRHQLFSLSVRSNLDAAPSPVLCQCTSLRTFHGGSTQKLLGRTSLLPHPRSSGAMLVCAADEASKSVRVWDGASGQLLQRLPQPAPVVDICPVTINQRHLLVTLTDTHITLHETS